MAAAITTEVKVILAAAITTEVKVILEVIITGDIMVVIFVHILIVTVTTLTEDSVIAFLNHLHLGIACEMKAIIQEMY